MQYDTQTEEFPRGAGKLEANFQISFRCKKLVTELNNLWDHFYKIDKA